MSAQPPCAQTTAGRGRGKRAVRVEIEEMEMEEIVECST